MCARCEVALDCLDAGQHEEGIWGGRTESERRRAALQIRYVPPTPQPVVFTAVAAEPEISTDNWTLLESDGDAKLFRRDSATSWHGSEFVVVRATRIVTITIDLGNAYIEYRRVLS